MRYKGQFFNSWQQPDKILVSSCKYICYISLEWVKLCCHGCMIFARLLNAKMKIQVFENFMVIYTGRKIDQNQGDFTEEQRAYCKICGLLGKAHQKLSLNWIQCTERILFHIKQLPDGYLILKRVDLVLKMRPIRANPFRPPLKMMLLLSNLLFSKIHDILWKR